MSQRRRPQKAKHKKRPRAWHHRANQDRKYRRALELLRTAQ
jgi:hypothetical protein